MKKALKSILSFHFVVLSLLAYSQTGGVSINNNNIPAHPSAMLDVGSTSAPYMGMLIPRMTTANRNAIVSPATGLQIFNTDCGLNEYYTGNCWVSMGQVLKTPDHIVCSGTTDFCANETRIFTIPAVTGAIGYEWTVPAGASVISGQGTTSATVIFGNHSGDVCVRAGNLCESSANSCINVYVNPVPPTPGNITGPITIVPSSTASYFIASVAGAGVYNWTVPAGATITSGIGTTTITVNFSCSAVSGSVSVAAQSNCGTSTYNSLAIGVTPVVANAGPAILTPDTLGGSPTATGGTSPYTYAWLPSTGLSSTTVANPTSTVCPLTTYTVTVTDANGCTATSMTTASNVNPAPPSTPGSINGNISICANSSGNVYSISSVATATSYLWTTPAGGSVTSGQGTTTATISFGATSGNVSVSAINSCGSGAANSLAITLNVNNGSQTFNATGLTQNFTIPSCVSSITVKAWGAGGGGGGGAGASGGGGAYSSSVISVTQGEVLGIIVGGGGGNGIGCNTNCGGGSAGSGGDSGYGAGGNGGNSGTAGSSAGGGAGGGGSFVLRGATVLLAAGGGGGGAGAEGGGAGAGGGGGVNGDGGSCSSVGGSAGGSSSTIGTAGGTPPFDASAGGGGGGGFNGGTGGTYPNCDGTGGAGGGGGNSLGTTVNNGSGATPGNSGDSSRGSAGNGGSANNSGNVGILIINY